MTQNAIELEESVLGAIILDRNEYEAISDILKPEHFYESKHRYIYQSFVDLSAKKVPIELMSVVGDIKNKSLLEHCGGVYGISKLSDKAFLANTVEYKARVIFEKYLLRQIYYFAENIKAKTLLPVADCFDLSNEFKTFLDDISNKIDIKKVKPLIEHRDDIISDMRTTLEENGKTNGVPIRLERLSNWTNGWRNGHLIVIAARPGMGKTASAIEFAEYPAMLGMPVCFFSLEMSAKELTGRIMSIHSGFSAQRINNSIIDGEHDIEEIKFKTNKLKDIPLYIDDTPYLTMHKLRIKALKMKREKDIKLIVIDYLQLMEGEGTESNREQILSKISRGLKGLAKELDIPVIALAQLNRDVAKRGGDQKPKASDIRECGAIEQDADMILFPHRPEYLKVDTYMIDGQEISSKDLIVFIIEKFRGGAIGEIPAHWNGRLMQITD